MQYSTVLSALESQLGALQQKAIGWVPLLASAFIVLLVGIACAYVFRVVVHKAILGLDKTVRRVLARRGLSHTGLGRSANWFAGLVFWGIIIFSLAVASEVLGWDIVSTWLASVGRYLPKVLAAVGIAFVGLLGARTLRDIVANAADSGGLSYSEALGQLTQVVLVSVSFIVAAGQLGLEIEFLTRMILVVLTAVLAGAALAFGLGARGTISNILALYHIQRTFRVGQNIRIQEVDGKIVSLSPTGVSVETKEGVWVVPGHLFNEQASLIVKGPAHG